MNRPHEIDRFQDYIERGKVRDNRKDPAQASNLLRRSESKFETMERLGIEDETATDYLENVYESCKMLVQSLMAAEGFKPYSHEAIIAYAIDKLEIDLVNANTLNRYRKLRNDISYRGEIATTEEAKNIRQLYQELLNQLKPRIQDQK
ncbi:hypothetical protein [Candidatus Nanohalococcus occultus]|uniref:HEPN domain containing protein n=1 Tax=Candidatus Nanohalococcus occultus TaxID=2978047 RepID=A0ABY8CDW5_9ARCH|nr:HEPN domain containing protein [Candidatus Nanohaloarchaeota archaeon SVXNc]